MPRVSQWFIRTAMIYLVAALVVGAVMQMPFAARLPLFRALWPTYVHLLVVGWLTQLIFGVAYWMFPRYSAERPRGSERLGWATFALLNVGLMLRVIAEPWHALAGQGAALALLNLGIQTVALGGAAGAPSTLGLLGRCAEGLAAGAFALHAWPRVKMFANEDKGAERVRRSE